MIFIGWFVRTDCSPPLVKLCLLLGSQEEYRSCCIPALKAGTAGWGNVLRKKSHRNLKIRMEDLPFYYNWIRKNREEEKN